MCGIAGVFDLSHHEQVAAATLKSMGQSLAHRGPDDIGYYTDRFMGMAHRRLAIIDPTPAGHQPMVSPDGAVALVFNGAIFNFQELRAQLQAMGHRFTSRCDTEVLVHGWEAWGEDLVPKLNGHFAFVVWDSRCRRLYMVRDRFGAKPLYFSNQGGLWLFASEIKAILRYPGFKREINHDALIEYFTFQNLFRHHTMFKNIHMVPPANILSVDADHGDWRRRSYWDYDFSRPHDSMDKVEAREEVSRLLVQATNRQLVSDVPVGAYLSGGMDSGSIVSIATRSMPALSTFTCGWHLSNVEKSENNFDERLQAEMLADLLQTEHFEQVLGHSSSISVLPKLIYHLEDLRMGMSYGMYYIARLASRFVKVCLSGTGGDELFGGYPWRYFRANSCQGKQSFLDDYYRYWQRLVNDEERKDFFTPMVNGQVRDWDMRRVLARVFTFNPNLNFETPENHVANSLYFEAKTFLHGLLIVGDRLSMAHGLEERFPFLDNDLVDFAQVIPPRLKLRDLHKWKTQDENISGNKRQNYFAAHNDGKNILRDAMANFLPEKVLQRRKQGFSSPDESWYRGANLDYVEKLVLSRRSLLHEFIEPEAIRRTLEQHKRGERNLRLRIWSLVSFEWWLKIFFDDWRDEAMGVLREFPA